MPNPHAVRLVDILLDGLEDRAVDELTAQINQGAMGTWFVTDIDVDVVLRKALQPVFPGVLRDAARIYEDTYTAEQLAELVTFLDSPTGQAFLRHSDAVSRSVHAALLVRGRTLALDAMHAAVTAQQEAGGQTPSDQLYDA